MPSATDKRIKALAAAISAQVTIAPTVREVVITDTNPIPEEGERGF